MHNTLNNLIDYKNEIQQQYPIKIDLRLIRMNALTGGGGEIAILTFILGAISGGFFSEIGKDFWIKLKDLCKKIYDSRKPHKRRSKGIILVECEYRNYQIVAVLEVNKVNRSKFDILCKGDILDYFWKELPIRLKSIMENADDRKSKTENVITFQLSLNTEKASWIIDKFAKRIDTSKYFEKVLK
jgi:hypothetical protein